MKFAVQLVALKVEKNGSKKVHRVLGQYVNRLGAPGGTEWNTQRGVKMCFHEPGQIPQKGMMNPRVFEKKRMEAEKKKRTSGRGVRGLVTDEEYFPLRKYRMVTVGGVGARSRGGRSNTRMSMAIGRASEEKKGLISGGASSVQVEETETELCVCCAVVPQPCTIEELQTHMIRTAGKSSYLGGKVDDKVREACWDLYTVALYLYERGALPLEGGLNKSASEKKAKAKAAADDDSDEESDDEDEEEVELDEVKKFMEFDERSALETASWVPQGINTKPFKICREVDGREELAGAQFLFEAHHDGRSYNPPPGPDHEKKLHRRKAAPIGEEHAKMYEKKMGKAELKDIFGIWQVWRRHFRNHVMGAGSGKQMRKENDDVRLQYVRPGGDDADDDSDDDLDLRDKLVEYSWEKADATKCAITPIVWRREGAQNGRRLAEDWAQDLMIRVCAAQQDGQINFKSASLKKLVMRLQDKVDWCQKITPSTVKDKTVKNKAGNLENCLNALDTIKRKTYIDKEMEFQDRKDGYKLDNKSKRQFFADEGLELPPAELHEKTLEGLKAKVSKANKELKKMQERLELAQAQNQKELIETNDLVEGVAKAKRDVEAEKKAMEACKAKKSAAEAKAIGGFEAKVEQRKTNLMEMAAHILAGAITEQRKLTETKKKAKKGKDMEKLKKKNSAKKVKKSSSRSR
jgi:hypothetical protein